MEPPEHWKAGRMTRAGTAAAAAAKAKNPPSPIKERPKVPAQPQGRQGPPTLDDEAVEKLKEWAISKGINEIRLDVYNENTTARKAYEKVFIKQ